MYKIVNKDMYLFLTKETMNATVGTVFRKCFIILFLNEFMKSSFLPKYESNVVRISPLYCATTTGQKLLQFLVHILGETMTS